MMPVLATIRALLKFKDHTTISEFATDPMAVQCFDRRIVERVALCVARRKRHEKSVVI